MEREVGGGIGMGNICKPMAVSFQCMTKFTTKKKKRSLDSMTCSRDVNLSKHQDIVKDREGWQAAVHRVTKSQT